MVFFEPTSYIGMGIIGFTNLTGSLFLTMFCLMIVLFFIAMALGLPIELTAIVYLPLLIAYASYSSDYLALFGLVLIYGGIMLGKYLFSK